MASVRATLMATLKATFTATLVATLLFYLLRIMIWTAESYYSQRARSFLIFSTIRKALFSKMSDTPVFKANYKGPGFPKTPDQPLPAEDKYKTQFESISFFRRYSRQSFPIEKALQDYHREPIAYALALAQLNTQVFNATRKHAAKLVASFIYILARDRRDRDMVSLEDYDSGSAGLKFSHILRFWKSRFSNILDGYFLEKLDKRTKGARSENAAQPDDQMITAWYPQFRNYIANVNFFCQHTGSEVDDLAPPHKTIQNLRKFASDRRQELAPLLEVNAKLNKELTSYKRINAALQTRYTIEKLVFELPDTAQYDVTGSGPNGKNCGTKSGKTQATTLTIHFTPSGRRRQASTLETISERRGGLSLLT